MDSRKEKQKSGEQTTSEAIEQQAAAQEKLEFKVYIVDDVYFNKLSIISQTNPLYLCQSTNNNSYEILYKNSVIISLSQTNDSQVVWERFHTLSGFLSINPKCGRCPLCESTNPSLETFEQIIRTMVVRPKWFPIHVAAYNNVICYFHGAKLSAAEINAQSEPNKLTPLHLSVYQGHNQLIKHLLKLKPDITLTDSQGNTALHAAAMAENNAIFEKFLKMSQIWAEFNRVNDEGHTPIAILCLFGKPMQIFKAMKVGVTAKALTVVDHKDPASRNLFNQMNDTEVLHFNQEYFQKGNFDFEEINKGGCPLHWVTESGMLAVLLQYFNVNTPNLERETPLFVIGSKGSLSCALTLLNSQVDPNITDENGNTLLHLASSAGCLSLVKALIIFDANINQLNKQLQSPRHCAAIGNNKEIVYLLNQMGVEKCLQTVKGCNEFCNDFTKPPDSYVYPYNNSPRQKEFAKKFISNKKKKRLICCDGGGVRGLLTAQILIELEKYLKHDLSNYFQWISGTGTGSLIAYGLSIGLKLFEIRKLYFSFKDLLFTGSKPYDEDEIEKVLQEKAKANISLNEVWSKHSKYLIITTSRIENNQAFLQLFRSYSYPNEKSRTNENFNVFTDNRFEAWKALRCSTATPGQFPPFQKIYYDGGLFASNPTLDTLVEFHRYQASVKRFNKQATTKMDVPELGLVLSVGVGLQPLETKEKNKKFFTFQDPELLKGKKIVDPWVKERFDWLTDLLSMADYDVVLRSEKWCTSINTIFVRINPPVSSFPAQDEINDEPLINYIWEAKLFALKMAQQLKDLASLLEEIDETLIK